MSKKQMWLSIGLNIVLIAGLVVGVIGTKFARNQVYLTGVQRNLVFLSGGIAHQVERGWTEPQLVVQALQSTVDGLYIAQENSRLTLLPTSTKDKQLMQELMVFLQRYPLNETYKLVELTAEDKDRLKQLGESLRNSGFGTGIAYAANMKSFMKQVEQLHREISW